LGDSFRLFIVEAGAMVVIMLAKFQVNSIDPS
jgi:hypothetical protein